MERHDRIYSCRYDLVFTGEEERANERRTQIVIGLTGAMMVLEIVAGVLLGSMALLADGWHMASHAAALGITALGPSLPAQRFALPALLAGRRGVCDVNPA
jgi:Co/Zn/Cd efflux system component